MAEQDAVGKILNAFRPEAFAKDLFIVALWMFTAVIFVWVPVLNQSFLRIIFTLPIILFIPGYVLIAALFPGKEDLDGIERLALSFGLSIIVVSLIGFVLNYTPWGIRFEPVITSLVVFTTLMLILAQYYRFILSPEKRFCIPFHDILVETRGVIFELGQSRVNRVFSLIIMIAIVAVISTATYAIMTPTGDAKFTEFYILGPGGKASDFPDRFPVGKEQSLIIGIGNHENQNITYTVEMILLRMTFDPVTNRPSIDAYYPLDTFTATISHNETREFPYNFTVNDQRYNRLEVLLFNETVPSSRITRQERFDASYRELHLWFTIRS